VTYIGADGAGHYVKMVHNGIEYGDMQLIAEAYALLKGGLNLSNEELAQTFTEWNEGELSSYLIDITKDIFTKKDEEGKYLVDVILDEAANKGTGKWTSQSSLDLGEPLSLITESVFARYISSLKDRESSLTFLEEFLRLVETGAGIPQEESSIPVIMEQAATGEWQEDGAFITEGIFDISLYLTNDGVRIYVSYSNPQVMESQET